MENEYYNRSYGDTEPSDTPTGEIRYQPWPSEESRYQQKQPEEPWSQSRVPDSSDTAPLPPAVSEYRAMRPGYGAEYRDAGYIPRAEAPIAPRYQFQEPRYQQQREKKRSGGGVVGFICACLVCAVLGGAAGGAVTGGYYNRLWNDTEASALQPNSSQSNQQVSDPPVTTPQSRPIYNADGDTLSGEEIYALGINQTVGVTTTLTTTNRFGQTSSSAVSGSGFIIREDGYIITNYHVIESAFTGGYQVYVFLESGDKYPAQIINVEPDNDIAVLKIEASGLSAVAIGDSDNTRVGEMAYVIGNPLGELTYTMTSGIISALDREIATESENKTINMFQIDAAVNRGNSGGPVFNSRGEVIGVVTAKYSDTGVEGLGFAIPINDAIRIADNIIEKGVKDGKPAYLGVLNAKTMDEVSALYYNNTAGVLVQGIQQGSSAEAAGMQPGDIITKLGGSSITSTAGLAAALRNYRAGDSAMITVYRNGQYLELAVVFGEAPVAAG